MILQFNVFSNTKFYSKADMWTSWCCDITSQVFTICQDSLCDTMNVRTYSEIFQLISLQRNTCWSQDHQIHPMGSMNNYKKCYRSLPNSCYDFLARDKAVEWLIDQHCLEARMAKNKLYVFRWLPWQHWSLLSWQQGQEFPKELLTFCLDQVEKHT